MLRHTLTLVLLLLMSSSPAGADARTTRAWSLLEAALKAESHETRTRGVRSLALLVRSGRAEKLAIAGLGDKEDDVRTAAADSLGEIGLASAAPSLVKAASEDDASQVVFAAAGALFKLKDPRAFEVYYAALTKQRKSGDSLLGSQLKILKDTKAMALIGFEQGLGFIPFAGLGYGVIKTIARDDESPVRAAAALRLAHDPDPRSGAALEAATADEKWLVRAAALDALARRGDHAFVRAALRRLDDENETVRLNAAACIIRLAR